MTIREIVTQVRRELKEAGIEDYECESWMLLDWLLHIDRAEYYSNLEKEVEARDRELLFSVVEKRRKHIPLQYLMKECEFMGLSFFVDERVLIPRQDTECLVELAMEEIKKRQGVCRVLDLCTGSGCIGLSLAKLCPGISVTLSDVSEGALAVAAKNSEKLQVRPCLVRSDLFDNIPGTFHYIVSNPPYIPSRIVEGLMPEVREYEPRLALDGGEDGLNFYRKIIRRAGEHLEDGGRLFFEIGAKQGEDLRRLMEEHGYINVQVKRDLAGLDRIVTGTFQKCRMEKEEKICLIN
ncbi:MAG: peptide chain release factor N(5)-glutamine methyltransferase [Eubacterium sp.]|nr:peptide chain release factor N(5)-glutamine methyltransferase [Eubacterium sp.]MDD7208698.1 peptide chain release factor N(5)-glutamine methyltransferase [Lachnospiraceae bacterium]MDY5497141.1 peptide chain release factor N(5)-glutamine methyltransferase [Anaerobutyricum sp.]